MVTADKATGIFLEVSIDGRSMADYWRDAVDGIFQYADVNANALIDEDELQWVPSARAIRLSLGNGFVPPVAPITTISQITGDETSSCTRQALAAYYQHHG